MGVEEIPGQPLDDNPANLRIARELAVNGWSVSDRFLPPSLVGRLADDLLESWRQGDFRRAGVGRDESFQLKPEVRSDHVRWLDRNDCSEAGRLYLNALEELRLAVNRELYLGLFDFEGHMAVYPPGCYYRKHLDQFLGVGLRTLTCILYLNRDWQPADGGELRIYTDPEDENRYREVEPLGGRLVTFFSAHYLHEVMPARRERLSITGWFKVRQN